MSASRSGLSHDAPRRGRFRAALVVNFTLFSVFTVASLALVQQVRSGIRSEAVRQAEEKARIILDRNLATHTYFSHSLKPAVFPISDKVMPESYFEPSWMSSTFAVREIDRLFHTLNPDDYYYKECAINARSPANEADAYERAYIEGLNRGTAPPRLTEVREIEGMPFLAVLRKGESMEADCLRCHDTPQRAPADLVARYGGVRSFHRSVDEVVSAISIRIPLAEAFAGAEHTVRRLSVILVAALLVLIAFQAFLNRHLIFSPLDRIRGKALEIATDEKHLGEEIALPAARELAELSRAFNIMSGILRRDRDNLEGTVQARTAELRASNADLTRALSEVKTLSGLLPICASCKKVRDDGGYWNQIEEYLTRHSGAVFSHGLCPECVGTYFPAEPHGAPQGVDANDQGP